MRIERQRPRHAASQRPVHHEVQRRDFGQLIADNLAFDNAGEVRLDALRRDLGEQQEALRQQTSLLELLHQVTLAANRANSSEEAYENTLRLLCAHTRWPVGHVYVAATDGNLSVRLDDERILVTPTGMSKSMLRASDMVVVDLEERGTVMPATNVEMTPPMLPAIPPRETRLATWLRGTISDASVSLLTLQQEFAATRIATVATATQVCEVCTATSARGMKHAEPIISRRRATRESTPRLTIQSEKIPPSGPPSRGEASGGIHASRATV